MFRTLAPLLLLASFGCSFNSPSAPDASVGGPDGTPNDCDLICTDNTLVCADDVSKNVVCPLGCTDGEAECLTFSFSNAVTEHGFDESLVGPLEISGDAIIDTDTGKIVVDGVTVREAGPEILSGIGFVSRDVGGSYGQFVVSGLTINSGVRVEFVGAQAVAIFSVGDANIAGRVEASANLVACAVGNPRFCPGPGGGLGGTAAALSSGCASGLSGTGGTGNESESGGGGGGNGVAASGRVGGNGGDSSGGTPSAGGAGGSTTNGNSCIAPEVVPLIGGSGGGRGGPQDPAGTNHSVGGGGGGAIQIASRSVISIVGSGAFAGVNAGGEGGEGGRGVADDGGGGGGGGGAVLLEAPNVTLSMARLTANGGGGGGGGDGAGSGVRGRFDNMRAGGGSVGTTGSAGGRGGTNEAAEAALEALDGGGGGGGAAGRIRINALMLDDAPTVVYSPEPSINVPAN